MISTINVKYSYRLFYLNVTILHALCFVSYGFQHYRNVLKCMQLIQINTEHDEEGFEALSHIVHEMQVIFE